MYQAINIRLILVLILGINIFMLISPGRHSYAQDLQFFQIGTGPADETRFALGGLIANALSNPPGSRPCEKGGSCGVPNLVAVAKSTGGDLANLEALRAKRLDAALVNADMAFYAFHGTGPFAKSGAIAHLRAIAMVSTEALYIIVPADSPIQELADLSGKKIALGDRNSPAHLLGRELLEQAKLKRRPQTTSLSPHKGVEALLKGDIDAWITIDGQPSPLIADLANAASIRLIPVPNAALEKLREKKPFLSATEIKPELYRNIDKPIPTLGVSLTLMTTATQSNELIYGVTKALWHPSTQATITQAWARDLGMKLDENALVRLGVPLHGGAQGYYFDRNISD